ncbi:hypothetical protein [Halocalculus aciditolerans]|uniref:DUF7981 domain-containing protein n=1 Tax=Halocalculus aciditolerans TaxID=1383812 RepID=A0A830EZV2_9EURY|nr:hypothetical protein [Halocalculus aciditolerans]GGL48756.1 hypothetical protein GCM10009039_03690 [Halocalculus aciditolerans]
MHARELALDGALAALSFLVLAFGYRLLGGDTPGVPALVGVCLLVTAVTVVATWLARTYASVTA